MQVFTGTTWRGQQAASEEIAPEWHPVDALPLTEMWDDARYWLPQVLTGQHLDADITFADDCRTVAQVAVRFRDGSGA